jgi:hypothetical protein
MADKNLVGRCGLFCGICSVYRAYKDSREFQEKIAERYGCLPEEVRCEDCQTLDVHGWSHEKDWGKNCKVLKCLNSRKLRFCSECAKYNTCQRFDEFARMNSYFGIDVKRNLQMIKEGKIEEWLLEQDKKWRCPSCGNPVAVSSDFRNCHWCRNKLSWRRNAHDSK